MYKKGIVLAFDVLYSEFEVNDLCLKDEHDNVPNRIYSPMRLVSVVVAPAFRVFFAL